MNAANWCRAVVKIVVMSSCMLAASAAFARVPAYSSSITNNLWSADGGNWSGDYTAESRWSKGHLPGIFEWCTISPAADAVVTMPSGTYDTFSNPMFSVPSGVTLQICGTNSVFRQAATSEECYPENVWGVGYGGTRFFAATITSSFGTNSRVSEISNYSFRVSSDANGRPTAHFDRGVYDFDAGSSHAVTMLMFDSAATGQGLTTIEFHTGTTFRAYNIMAQAGVDEAALRFDGATARVSGSAQFPSASRGFRQEVATTTRLECVNGADVQMQSLWFGVMGASYGCTTQKTYRVKLDGGSKLSIDGSFGMRRGGDFRIDVSDGSELSVGSGGNIYLPDASNTDPVGGRLVSAVFVSNATFRADGAVHFGKRQYPDAASTSEIVLADRSVMSNANGFSAYGGTRMSLSDSSWTADGAVNFYSSALAALPGPVFAVTNSSLAFSKDLTIGNGTADDPAPTVSLAKGSSLSVDSNLYLQNGDVQMVDSSLSGTGKLTFGSSSGTWLPSLVMSNSTVDVSGKSFYYSGDIVAEDCDWTWPSDGTYGSPGNLNVTLRGGSCVCDKAQLTFGGMDSVLKLEKGAVFDHGTTYSFYLSSTAGGLATLHLVDGTFRSTNIRLNNTATSRSLVKLDGGTLELKNGFILQNSGTTARLEANGGKVKVLNNNATFTGFSATAIGSRGLTIDSNGHPMTITQAFADAAGESGTLVLAGDGVKTLNGAGTTVSTIVVAGGKVVFANDFAFAGRLVVTNGATVALGGSMTTLSELVLGDGTTAGIVEMAPTDTIAVSGPVVSSSSLAMRSLLYFDGLRILYQTAASHVHDGHERTLIPENP